MNTNEEKFIAFLEALADTENQVLIGTIMEGFQTIVEEQKKWSQDVDVKKGSLTKAIGDAPSDLSGKQVADRAIKAFGRKEAASKINFAANVAKKPNAHISAAQHYLSEHPKK